MNCPFCLGANAGPTSIAELAAEHASIRGRILSARPNGLLIAGLGALVYPYVLFITRRHVTGVNATSRAERQDLFAALHECVASGLFASPTLTLFEHGGSGPNACSCVDHCHIHIIDGQYALRKMLLETSTDTSPTAVTVEQVAGFPAEQPYLWAASYSGHSQSIEGCVRTATNEGQQYFRRMLAGWNRSLDWNWRDHPRWDNVDRLVGNWPHRNVEG